VLTDLDRARDTLSAFIGLWDDCSRKSEPRVEKGAPGK